MSKTIAEYLIETYGDDAIEKYWGDKNEKSPYEYSYRSGKKVWFKCVEKDYHGEYETKVYSFTNNHFCPYCSSTLIHEKDSFGQWLEDTGNIKYLSKKNKLDLFKLSKNSTQKIIMLCEKVEYHGEYETTCKNYYSGRRCSYCGKHKTHPRDSLGQWMKDRNLLHLFSEENNKNPFEIPYSSNNTKVKLKCEKHGIYELVCNKFTSGQRCPYCAGKKVRYEDSLKRYMELNNVYDLWDEKNTINPEEVLKNSHKKALFKCCCGEHESTFRIIKNATSCEFRCPKCSEERTESIYQQKTRSYLMELNLETKNEENCTIVPKNPKNKYNLPFDNEVVTLKLIIEVHGEQHYKLFPKENKWLLGYNPEEYLHKRKLYDRYKSYIAYINGYHYLEIPYWEFDKEDTYKATIDKKIKEIKEAL